MSRTKKLSAFFISAGIVFTSSIIHAQFLVPKATDWEGVVAKVITCKQTPHFLYAEMELIHTEGDRSIVHISIDIKKMFLRDAASGKEYRVLHDNDGHYLAGPLSGESSSLIEEQLEPDENVILWAFFTTMPTPSAPVDFLWPGINHFNRVPIQLGKIDDTTDFGSCYPDIAIQQIRIHRLRRVVQTRVQLSKTRSESTDDRWIYYRNMILYDYKNQRLYPLMKNREGQLIGEPHTDIVAGGRLSLSVLKERPRWLLLKFDPPPDWVERMILIAPFLRPNRFIKSTGKSLVQNQRGTLVQGGSDLFSIAEKTLNPVQEKDICLLTLSLDEIFSPDQFDVEPNLPVLHYLLAYIRGLPLKSIQIDVYSDNHGNPAFLMVISNKQAEALGKWLTDVLKSYCTVSWEGKGPQKPVASNNTEEGRMANRRIEVRLQKLVK